MKLQLLSIFNTDNFDALKTLRIKTKSTVKLGHKINTKGV